jgi:S-adenosylmethionine/arginine decarboxylase-like enzyme
MKPWGFALSLDIARCKPALIRCPYNIKDFSNSLVKRIDMKKFGEPHIVRFGSGNKQGYTLVQLIETSNITGHFCEETNSGYIDIFSCREYDIEEAIRVVKDHFEPDYVIKHYLERGVEDIFHEQAHELK